MLNTEIREVAVLNPTFKNEHVKRPRSVYRPSSRENVYKKNCTTSTANLKKPANSKGTFNW
jgi:hypothetical protein